LGQHLHERLAQRRAVAPGHQAAGDPVLNELKVSALGRGDGRRPCSHALQQHVGETLVAGVQDEGVGCPEIVRHQCAIHLPGEAHCVLQAKRRRKLLEVRAQGAITHHDQAKAGHTLP
jgi:hypothetical protein